MSEHPDPDRTDVSAKVAGVPARRAYWDALADRQPSPALRHRLVRSDALAGRLRAAVLAPSRSAVHIGEGKA